MGAFSLFGCMFIFLEIVFDGQTGGAPFRIGAVVERDGTAQLRQSKKTERGAKAGAAIGNGLRVASDAAKSEKFIELLRRAENVSVRADLVAGKIRGAGNVAGARVVFEIAGEFIGCAEVEQFCSVIFLDVFGGGSKFGAQIYGESARCGLNGAIKNFALICAPLFPKSFHDVDVVASKICKNPGEEGGVAAVGIVVEHGSTLRVEAGAAETAGKFLGREQPAAGVTLLGGGKVHGVLEMAGHVANGRARIEEKKFRRIEALLHPIRGYQMKHGHLPFDVRGVAGIQETRG